VLRTDNNILYQRLEKRNYNMRKIQENVQCEIFQTILDEAKDSYRNDIVFELVSNSPDDLHENLQKIEFWIANWKKNNQLIYNSSSS
jgi:adenylate kinase